MRRLLLLSLLLCVSCGGGLTAPTPAPSPTPTPSIQTPTPAPEPPAPEPAPVPAPVPAPAPPAPAPKPQPQLLLDASTALSHWYGPAVIPTSFIIEVWPDAVWLGEHRVPRVDVPGDGILARTDSETVSITPAGGKWLWTFNGIAGQANGEAVRR